MHIADVLQRIIKKTLTLQEKRFVVVDKNKERYKDHKHPSFLIFFFFQQEERSPRQAFSIDMIDKDGYLHLLGGTTILY